MSIFSRVKKSAQSAKKHNAKLAEQKRKEEEEAQVTPYWHVPTHAASDLLSSAPRSWVEADRPVIVEANQRRSAAAMVMNRSRLSVPGTPRMSSSLSYVAYPQDEAISPVIPRSYSYTGTPGKGNEAMYQVPQMAHSQPYSLKGKQAVRWPIYETPDHGFDFGTDTTSSEKSSGSSGDGDHLDVRTAGDWQSIGTASTSDTTHATAFKRSRRQSDPAADRRPGQSAATRDGRPPPSTRGFRSIPASAAPSPLQPGQLPGHLLTDATLPSTSTPDYLSPTSAASPTQKAHRPTLSTDKKMARLQALNRLVSGDLPSQPPATRARGPNPTAFRPTPTAPADPSPLATEIDPFSVIGMAVTENDQPGDKGAVDVVQRDNKPLDEVESKGPAQQEQEANNLAKSTPAQVVNTMPAPLPSPSADSSPQKSGFMKFSKGGKKLLRKTKT